MLAMQHRVTSLPPNIDVHNLPLAGPPPQRFATAVTGIAVVDRVEDARLVGLFVQEYRRLCPRHVQRRHTAVAHDVLLDELAEELHGASTTFVSAGSGAVQVSRTTQARRYKALVEKEEEALFCPGPSDAFADGGYIVFSDQFLLSNRSSPVMNRHLSRATSRRSFASVTSMQSTGNLTSLNQLHAFPPPRGSTGALHICASVSDEPSDIDDERARTALSASTRSRGSSAQEDELAAEAVALKVARMAQVNLLIAQAEEYHRPMFRRIDSSRLYGEPTPYTRAVSA